MGTASRSPQCKIIQVLLSMWGHYVINKYAHKHTHTRTHVRTNVYVCILSKSKSKIFFLIIILETLGIRVRLEQDSYCGIKGFLFDPFHYKCVKKVMWSQHTHHLCQPVLLGLMIKNKRKLRTWERIARERTEREVCKTNTPNISIPGIGAWNIEPSYFLKVVINVMPHPRSSPRHFHPTNGRILLALH